MSYINEYFDKIFCINLDRREDRMEMANKELSKFNIEFERFSAVDGNNIKKEDYTTNPNIPVGAVGCLLSHLNLIKTCKERGYNRVLILEDDIILSDDFESRFKEYIKEIPENWDMFYLGGNHNEHSGMKLNMISPNVGKCSHTFSAHAYAINEKMFDETISIISKAEKEVDVYYSEFQNRKNIYTFFPGIASQKADYSDILNKNVDYSKIIK